MAGMSRGGDRVCLCLIQVGVMGPGAMGEQWFSGVVFRPAASALSGNRQILGPHLRHPRPETCRVGPSTHSEAV